MLLEGVLGSHGPTRMFLEMTLTRVGGGGLPGLTATGPGLFQATLGRGAPRSALCSSPHTLTCLGSLWAPWWGRVLGPRLVVVGQVSGLDSGPACPQEAGTGGFLEEVSLVPKDQGATLQLGFPRGLSQLTLHCTELGVNPLQPSPLPRTVLSSGGHTSPRARLS